MAVSKLMSKTMSWQVNLVDWLKTMIALGKLKVQNTCIPLKSVHQFPENPKVAAVQNASTPVRTRGVCCYFSTRHR